MPGRLTEGPLRQRAALGALLLVVVACPLWRGGVDWFVELGAGALVIVSLLLASRDDRGGSDAPLLLSALATAVALVLLQLLPLPAAVQRIMSPAAADVFDAALRPLGLYPSLRPLSLDPGATAREAAKAATLLSAAGASLLLSSSRRNREVLLAAVSLAGALAVLAGLVAAVLGLGSYLEPKLTFVNPNHLAGFLALAAWPALGFGLRERGQARVLWLLAFIVAGLGIFLTLSRAGIAAFFVAAGVFTPLYVRRLALDRHRQFSWWRYGALPAGISAVLAVTAYLALGSVLSEMATVAHASWEAKLANWPDVVTMIRRFPLTGIGKGAFATAFPAYRTQTESMTFTHAENEWLQIPADLGLPVGLALLAAFAWTWWSAARRPDISRPEMGALAAMAAVAAQNFFDFSLEVLGVALPFTVMMMVLARRLPGKRVPRAGWQAAALAALAVIAAGMGVFLSHPTDRDAVQVAAASSGAEAVERARSAALWHPADYLPQAAAGIRLVQEGKCAEGLPWLGRAMWLGPMAPEPHRYAARCLAAAGNDPLAKQEYRLAILLGDPRALPEAARRYPALPDLLTLVPSTSAGLASLGGLLGPKRPVDAQVVWEKAWTESGEVGALHELAAATLAAGDAPRALDLARELRKHEPGRPRSYLLASYALDRMGDPDGAISELRLGAKAVPSSPDILVPLAGRLIAKRHFSEARLLLRDASWRSAAEAASVRLLDVAALRGQGRITEAMEQASAARDMDPESPRPYEVLAELLAETQRYQEAIAALGAAAAKPSSRPGAYDERIEALRAAALQKSGK